MKETMESNECKFEIKKVEVEEVLKIIQGVKNSSATGTDFIDTRTIKLASNLIAHPLTHIINLSISTSSFPNLWKHAKVVPLLKSTTADPLLPKSYRPVALLPILSKVLDKVVFGLFVKYLDENNLVHPNLHGSRTGHNTSTALIHFYDK